MHLARRHFPATVIVALFAAVSHAGTSDERAAAYSVQYQAGQGCPSESAFVSEIAARTARTVRRAPESSIPSFAVALSSEGEAFVGNLTARQPDGSNSTRSVRAPTCTEVAAALALVVALTLDPQAAIQRAPSPLPVTPPPHPASPSSASSPTPAASSLTDPSPATTNSSETGPFVPHAPRIQGKKESHFTTNRNRQRRQPMATAEPKQSPDVVDRDHPPAELVASAALPTVRSPFPTGEPSTTGGPKQLAQAFAVGATRPPADWALSAGARFAAQVALAPWWMLGGVLHGAAIHRNGWGVGVAGAAFPSSQDSSDGVTVAYGLWTLRGEGCYAAIRRIRLRAFGCAAFEAGRVTAGGQPGGPIATGVSGIAPWLAAVAISRVGVPIGLLTLEAQMELLAPLSRNQFGIRTGPAFAGKHQPPVLAIGASVGVAYRISE